LGGGAPHQGRRRHQAFARHRLDRARNGGCEKALEAGCDDYDTKPIELERLIGKIESLLSNGAKASRL